MIHDDQCDSQHTVTFCNWQGGVFKECGTSAHWTRCACADRALVIMRAQWESDAADAQSALAKKDETKAVVAAREEIEQLRTLVVRKDAFLSEVASEREHYRKRAERAEANVAALRDMVAPSIRRALAAYRERVE